jgi:hypothetical protein
VRPARIVFEEEPSRDDLDALKNAIDAFNYETTGFRDGRYLAAVRARRRRPDVAGLSGFTWGGYAKVEFLWIAEPHRRAGSAGDADAAEDEARARGCALIVLDTHDFQAPGFYAKLGYEACGRVEGTPRGSGQTWFKKSLA